MVDSGRVFCHGEFETSDVLACSELDFDKLVDLVLRECQARPGLSVDVPPAKFLMLKLFSLPSAKR